MKFAFYIAWRSLKPKKDSGFISFITFISIAGIAIGVAALIIAVSVLGGFEKEITRKAASLSSHIQITSYSPDGIKNFAEIENILRDISKGLNVLSVAPYVQREAVIKFKDYTEGVIVKGIRNEDSLFSERRKIVFGSKILSQIDSSASSIIIGNKLATKLGIEINSKVFLIATVGIPSAANTPSIKQFRVTGIYQSGLKDFDDVLLYVPIADAQKLFSMKESITGIELMMHDVESIKKNTVQINKLLGYPLNARSIFQNFKGLFTWVELQKEPIPVVLGLIVIVASINIIGFLLMIVLEKTHTIGILKSLGANDSEIVKIFFVQGAFISLAGIILGNIIGYGLCLLQLKYNLITIPDIYYLDKVPLILNYSTGIYITLIAILLSLVVTIIPSYLASRLEPIISLKFK